MKKLCMLLGMGIILLACNRQDQETPEPTDFGYLSMNISVTITEEPANGRVTAVPTDDWKVTIFNSDGTEYLVFDPYSSAPSEVQLPTGEYYVEAHSNNFQEAAFENPYYFGRSANFTIDKEELKTIDIDAELANSKVAINYSSNVTSTFNDYTGAVTVVSSGTTLDYVQGETREGYFASEPLRVVVNLSYTKLDGSFITRQFSADIDALPKTLYNINVDATLEDGEIILNINVDETFETVDIELGEIVTGELLPGSLVVTNDNDEQKIIDWLDPRFNTPAELIFVKELGDGKNAQDFHTSCDNIYDLLVVVETTDGHVFGGYNQVFWDASLSSYSINAVNNFLFSINNDIKWPHKPLFSGYDSNSIYSAINYGPTFGAGHDLYINNELDGGYTYGYTYFREGTDPALTVGYHGDFTGTDGQLGTWTINRMEIWKLNTIIIPTIDSDGDGTPDSAEIPGCELNPRC
ncbi:MAG: DUF4493 domain-containing protein [Bacteroidota bacterium]